jgi:4-amino-4-deoxy-L-arabinose transferase-like glycosyltransferase
MALAPKPGRAGLVAVVVAAAAARFGVVAWAGGRFLPVGDGVYYHKLALRLAAGLGYTWLWPDGAVTYAAHYPVGYPALLAGAYRLFGISPATAGGLAALLGVAASAATHRVALASAGPRAALGAGLAVALSPALVFYTPALMTEGVTASLLALSAWAVAAAREQKPARAPLFAALAGLVLGAATLVRPQSLLFAPFFGALAAPPGSGARARARDAVLALAAAIAVCVPWALRNCARMGRCTLVSFNGGWNLLIGASPAAKGTWAPLEVPEACRLVFDEAAKDACFGAVARQQIAAEPLRWLALLPAKWATTFDFPGAAPWYLFDSNPAAFPDAAKSTLAAVELASARLALVACLLALALAPGPRRPARAAVALAGVACAFGAHAYPAYLALAVAAALLGRALLRERLLAALAALVVAGTAIVHGVFFGAGRYGLVANQFVMALAGASAAAAPFRGARDWLVARARRAPSPR